MHFLAEGVLGHIRRQELLRAGDRVGVAVSGGNDSVALLRLLLELRGELGIVLSVVHFNHKLRGAESDGDQEFVAGLAREHGLEFFVEGADVKQHATEQHVSVETAARELRYGFFRRLFEQDAAEIPTSRKGGETWGTPISPHFDKITTGHTLDDQAETVLMRMIRGAGMRGIGGIYPRLAVEDDEGEVCGEIVRPLLGIRRRELEQYLKEIGQPWREDSTNTDATLTRNRVRKLLVPLLEKEFNPAVAENLAELAEIARAEEDYWENEVSGWMGTAVHWSTPEWARGATENEQLVQIGGGPMGLKPPLPSEPIGTASAVPFPDLQTPANASVDRLWFLGEPLAVQRRLVKAIGEDARIPLEFRHVEEILRFAAEGGPSGKELSLPLGWKLRRESHELTFVTPELREAPPPSDYDYELPLPGEVIIPQSNLIIEGRRISAENAADYNSDQLLGAESVRGPLRVRNWCPGDRFWPAHTKSPKKIKELLQERRVAHSERRFWPVVTSGEEIVWVKDFPVPAKLRAGRGREAILITAKRSSGE